MAENRKAEALSRALNPRPAKASGYAAKLAEMLRGFKEYKDANTPRSTRPAVSPAKVINEGLINPNAYNAPAANRFKDSAFGMLGIVPGVGDAASAAESADLFNRGEKFAGSLAALGALPMLPSFAGMVKQGGKVTDALASPVSAARTINTLSEAPEVAEGMKRLFRAESPTVKFDDVFDRDGLPEFATDKTGTRFTDDFKYADYFRKSYGPDAKLSYVDVPVDVAERGRINGYEFRIE